jgi:hypothetical protein
MKLPLAEESAQNAEELLLQQSELTEIQTQLERRNGEQRVACTLSSIQISSQEGGPTDVKGFVLNVSKSGLGLCADKAVRPGTNVVVALRSLKITGNVRWCRRNPGDFFDIGLQIQSAVATAQNTPKAPDYNI